MSQSRTLFVGMDVHKEPIAVAYVAQDHGAEVTYVGTIGTRQRDLDTLIRQMHRKPSTASFSPKRGLAALGSSALCRNKGDDGWVVAPSLMPKKAGSGSRRTAVMRSMGPDWPARGTSRRCMSHSGRRSASGLAHGRAKR